MYGHKGPPSAAVLVDPVGQDLFPHARFPEYEDGGVGLRRMPCLLKRDVHAAAVVIMPFGKADRGKIGRTARFFRLFLEGKPVEALIQTVAVPQFPDEARSLLFFKIDEAPRQQRARKDAAQGALARLQGEDKGDPAGIRKQQGLAGRDVRMDALPRKMRQAAFKIDFGDVHALQKAGSAASGELRQQAALRAKIALHRTEDVPPHGLKR